MGKIFKVMLIKNSEKLIIEGMGHNFPTSVIPVIIEKMVNHFEE